MKRLIIAWIVCFPVEVPGQDFKDSMKVYFDNYITNHEVVLEDNKKHILFFDADPDFRVMARFEKTENNPWVPFATSGKMKKNYRVYGVLHFKVNDTAFQLNLYQSQDLFFSDDYKDYLFLPFTDATNGIETYEAGRYIDLKFRDIHSNSVLIDFNKAYNPYCAYVSGVFSCPIPPIENNLKIAIRAGERKFKKD